VFLAVLGARLVKGAAEGRGGFRAALGLES